MALQVKPRWRYTAGAAIACWSLATIGTLSPQSLNWKSSEKIKDEHTIPTVLSVVDEASGSYLYALENPLYVKLQGGTFLSHNHEKKNIAEPPQINLNQTEIESRDPVQLSWTLGLSLTGEPVVDDNDVIILYCDEQVMEKDPDFREFLDAATVGQAKATSKKHFKEKVEEDDITLGDSDWYFPSFPVVRREVCQFKLYKSMPGDNFALLASSEHLHIAYGKTTPTAIHLALGNGIHEMVVQFKTGSEGIPVVNYGLDKDSLAIRATGTSRTYSAKDMCQSPATQEGPGMFQSPGQLHTVRLTNLEPNTKYHYMVGVEDHSATTWSKVFSFVSAPELKANPGPFSYLVYGDQGCPSVGWGMGGEWTAAMVSREVDGGLNSLPIRSVHHFGDLSYARGAAHIWDEWFQMISSFTTRVPLMVSIGNHEWDYTKKPNNRKDPSGMPAPYRPKWGNFGTDSGGECGVPTVEHFTMPKSTKSNGLFWYSYDFGNVHTTVISSEHDLSPGSFQYDWLEDDLKSVDRTKLPWLVLELHRPMYESIADPANHLVDDEIRKRIEHLLKRYQVDLVLAGHAHFYRRTCSGLYQHKCHNGGPTHLTVGSAGAWLSPRPKLPEDKWVEKIIHHTYGYGRITIANATALHFEFVKAGSSCDKSAGKILDEMWLFKDPMISIPTASEGIVAAQLAIDE